MPANGSERDFEQRARTLRELHDALHQAFRDEPRSSEHRARCAAFHERYDELAYPGGLQGALERLKVHDGTEVETAVCYLEADPRFFRSGYVAEEIVRRLKQCGLTKGQEKRLRRLVLRSLDGGGRRASRAYARLAGRLKTEAFVAEVEKRSRCPNAEVARRAVAVLHIWKSQK